MSVVKVFSDFKEPKRKEKGQDFRLEIAQDFDNLKENSKAYFFLMKRISDMRDVAMYHVMLTAGEPIGSQWKAKLMQLDEVLGIPEEFKQKGVEAMEETKLRSII